jgi:hypothetical protein
MNPNNVLNTTHAIGTSTTGSILYSDSDWTGTQVATSFLTSTPLGVKATGQTQMPYSDSQYEYLWYTGTKNTRGLSIRPVGVGMRVRYIGTNLNQSGRMILARHPDNGDFSGTIASSLLDYQTIKTVPVSRQWHNVCYKPTASGDYEFSGNPITNSENQKDIIATTADLVKYCTYNMCIYVDGTVPGNAFEWEVCSFYEIAGATEGTTRSHTDLNGLSAVRNSTQSGPPTNSAVAQEKNALHKAVELLNPLLKTMGRRAAASLIHQATGGVLKLEDIGM